MFEVHKSLPFSISLFMDQYEHNVLCYINDDGYQYGNHWHVPSSFNCTGLYMFPTKQTFPIKRHDSIWGYNVVRNLYNLHKVSLTRCVVYADNVNHYDRSS